MLAKCQLSHMGEKKKKPKKTPKAQVIVQHESESCSTL